VTREAVDEMGLESGMRAVATVKATNVMVEVDE
jgi:molybdopterin-binding protein